MLVQIMHTNMCYFQLLIFKGCGSAILLRILLFGSFFRKKKSTCSSNFILFLFVCLFLCRYPLQLICKENKFYKAMERYSSLETRTFLSNTISSQMPNLKIRLPICFSRKLFQKKFLSLFFFRAIC